MGKRKRTDEEIRKKIRHLERKLQHSSDEENCEDYEQSFSSNQGIRSIASIPLEVNKDIDTVEQTTNILEPLTISPPDDIQNPAQALPEDILVALEVAKAKDEKFAPKIRDEVSKRWSKIIVEGLSKEAIQQLSEKTLIPENFKLLKAPELNMEIAAILPESKKNQDKRLEKAQNHLAKGIAAITNLMSTLLDKEMSKTDIIKNLSEAGQLLLDLHCQNTFARRKLITFTLDKKFWPMIHGAKRDTLLFGENLGDKIRASKAAEKSGLQIKKPFEPQPSTSNRYSQQTTRQGNSQGPPPRSQAQRGRRGGPRYLGSTQTYRRAPPATVDRDQTNSSAKSFKHKPAHKN